MNGILLTGKNGGQVFLPAAGNRWEDDLRNVGSNGCYWSSSLTPYADNSGYFDYNADGMYFTDYYGLWGKFADSRYNGLSVRAVCQ